MLSKEDETLNWEGMDLQDVEKLGKVFSKYDNQEEQVYEKSEGLSQISDST